MLALLVSLAHAQEPRPRHIEAEMPPADPVTPEPTVTTDNQTVVAPAPSSRTGGGGPAVRRETREAKGVAPTALAGRWTVVQVTDLGETEDYRVKMERSAMALDADCKTVALVFDFGQPAGTPGLPRLVDVSERRECYKGGLGKYMSETTLRTAATWTTNAQGQTVLQLPEMRADAALVRLRLDQGADVQSPPQWLGPEIRHERQRSEYAVLAEPPKHSRNPDDPPVAVHLTTPNGTTLHLEPMDPQG